MCRCDCGEEIVAIASPLRTRRKTSCPKCSRRKYNKDLTGMVFGNLTVIGYDEATSQEKSSQTRAFWKCQCSCGNMVSVNTSDLQSGKRKSCGCVTSKERSEFMRERVQKLGA